MASIPPGATRERKPLDDSSNQKVVARKKNQLAQDVAEKERYQLVPEPVDEQEGRCSECNADTEHQFIAQ